MSSIKDIAKTIKTTPEIVSGVFNYDSSISIDDTQKKDIVKASMDAELEILKDYKKNYHLKKKVCFGIVGSYPEERVLNNQFYLYVSMAISKLCKLDTIQTVEINVLNNEFSFKKEQKIDGVFAIGKFSDKQLENLELLSDNIIFIDSSPKPSKFDSILVNTQLGSLQALQYLFKLGHKKIAFLGGISINGQKELDWFYRSESTYIEFMKSHNIFDSSLLYEGKEISFFEGERLTTQILIDHKELPSAFFVCNDTMAMGVLTRLKEYEIKVPEKVSLMGFNNIPSVKFLNPPLTTVNIPMEFIAVNAIEILVKRVLKLVNFPRTLYSPTKLVIRDSTKTYRHR
ncbi:MAG: substrate-binding domain-containing protein [Sphaerochaetaceae bacterium]